MQLSVKGLAGACAILAGGMLFLVGIVNLMSESYARALLDLAASVYPGYSGPAGFGSVIVVTLYGLLDGAIGGAIFAWLYNMVVRSDATAA
jgi:hypothetical protein